MFANFTKHLTWICGFIIFCVLRVNNHVVCLLPLLLSLFRKLMLAVYLDLVMNVIGCRLAATSYLRWPLFFNKLPDEGLLKVCLYLLK